MMLRSLALENFGLYGGRTLFDLTPTVTRGSVCPIVLIGGRNGSGKTTFLEAVRLALYGQRALGTRVGKAEYEAYLAGRIYRAHGPSPATTGSGTSTAVELEFDFAESGTVHRYMVRREWSAGLRVRETLRLEKDGRLVDSVPRDEWHAFLQELIPPGVANLFFFDGEKVQEMADSDDDESSLVEAVRGLLGIETVARLRTDLGFYLARHRRRDDGEDGSNLETVEREFADLSDEIEAAVGEEAELASAREVRARVFEQARRRFVQEGGEVAARRSEIEAERDSLRRRIAQAESELHDLLNGTLPFAVAPRLMTRFKAMVEQRLHRDEGAAGTTLDLSATILAWRASSEPERSARWTEKHWFDLARFAKRLDGSIAGSGEKAEAGGEACLSEVGDLAAVRDKIMQAQTGAGPRSRELAKQLDTLGEDLRKVEGLLKRAEGFDASSSVLLDEMDSAQQQLDGAIAQLTKASELVRVLRHRASMLEKRKARILDQDEIAASAHRQTALAGRVGTTLAVYETRLMARKVARLESEFARAFRSLARKDDLIDRVSVDPSTFQVRLIARTGRELPKASLSAGERQIFAVALLWALARISGRPLPMIIDTPLARLDSEHRRRLVESYFPAASHQVILLSTDEEITGRLLQRLTPSVSHTYRLDYDPIQGRTVLNPGYFEGETGAPLNTGRAKVAEQGEGRAVRKA